MFEKSMGAAFKGTERLSFVLFLGRDFYGQFWPLEVSGGSGGGYELLVREVMHPYGIVMTIFV